MPTRDFKPDDRVIYARGVKEPLIGKAGVILEIDASDAPLIYANVQFDGLGSYLCWVGNLDPEPAPTV